MMNSKTYTHATLTLTLVLLICSYITFFFTSNHFWFITTILLMAVSVITAVLAFQTGLFPKYALLALAILVSLSIANYVRFQSMVRVSQDKHNKYESENITDSKDRTIQISTVSSYCELAEATSSFQKQDTKYSVQVDLSGCIYKFFYIAPCKLTLDLNANISCISKHTPPSCDNPVKNCVATISEKGTGGASNGTIQGRIQSNTQTNDNISSTNITLDFAINNAQKGVFIGEGTWRCTSENNNCIPTLIR
jgi:hypothetical protein